MNVIEPILAILLGYLAGSISFGNLVAGRAPGEEIEELRINGPGASTVYRMYGPRAAAAVFLGDFGKSAAVVSLMGRLISPEAAMLAGAAAVVGNNWPLFYGFRGGRGVAAAAGALAPLMPVPVALGLALAILALLITRNMVITSAALFFAAAALAWALAYPFSNGVYVAVLPGTVAAYTLLAGRRVPLGRRWRATFVRSRPAR